MNSKDFSSFIYAHKNSWTDTKSFRGLLNDYFPGEENKSYRNLILLCCEENIPQELKHHDSVSVNRCISKLCNSIGCAREKAEEIIRLWSDALSVFETESLVKTSPTYYLPTLSKSSIIFSDFIKTTPQVRLVHCVFGFDSDEDVDKARFDWTPGGYVFSGGPHDKDNSYRYSAPVEVIFDSLDDNESYTAIKQHGINMIREVCGYSFSDLENLFGAETANDIRIEFLQKGFLLNNDSKNYLSMYPDFIKSEAESGEDVYKLFLDVILLYCEWFTQYQDFIDSGRRDLNQFYEYKTIFFPYLSEYKRSKDGKYILKMLWDVFSHMSEGVFSLTDDNSTDESDEEKTDSEKTIILAEKVMDIYMDWIKLANMTWIWEIEYPEIIDDELKTVLDSFNGFERQCSDICQNWDTYKNKQDALPQFKPLITTIIEAEKTMLAGIILWTKTYSKENDNTDIGELDISVRAYNVLKRANINTIGDLTRMTISELRKVRLIRNDYVEQIVQQLAERGIYLKEE